ncbi:MAG: YIP1 family protein [Rhodobacteraceae bacterium]|nr:YIP1 family protein [Paracoccaceae bacterium]
MALTTDMLATYRRPAEVMRRHLSGPQQEGRALVFLMLACLLIFVAQWPRLAREAALSPDMPRDAIFGAALLGWVFIMPLVFYGLAALSHVVARLLGGQGTWYGARLALFWPLLALSPVWLLYGLVAGFIGAGPALSLVGVLAVGLFVFHWAVALRTAERPPSVTPAEADS